MAKKEKFKTAVTANTENLDYDDFDFESEISGMVDADVKKNKRSAVASTFSGAISGAKSAVLSPGNIKTLVKTALPEQYGEAFSLADTITGNTAALYNETVREIKPVANRVLKEVDKLVPTNMRRTKGALEKLKALTKGEDYSGPSKDQVREESIKGSLAEIFAIKAESDEADRARDKAEGSIRNRIEDKQHRDTHSLMASMATNLNRLSQNADTIGVAYQRKTLEIQLRSYYVQVDLLENTKKFNEIFKAQNDTITHNTALPEYVKVKKSELYKQMAMQKFFESSTKGLFGEHNPVENIFKALRSKVKEQTAGIKEAMEMGLMGMESINMSRENNEMMGEDGSASHMVGNLAGSMAVNELFFKGTKYVREKLIPKDGAIDKLGHSASAAINDPDGSIKAMRDSKFLESDYSGSIKDVIFSAFRDILGAGIRKSPDMALVEKGGMEGLSGASLFDESTRKSIVSIIPGYLAKIYQELQITRSGNKKQDLTVYDPVNDKFMPRQIMVENTRNDFNKSLKHESYNSGVEDIVDFITGGKDIGKAASNALRGIIGMLLKPGESLRAVNLYENNKFYRGLPGNVTSILKKTIKDKFGIQISERTEGGYVATNTQADAQLVKMLNEQRNKILDSRGKVTALDRAGLADIAEDAGLMSRDKEGKRKITDYSGMYTKNAQDNAPDYVDKRPKKPDLPPQPGSSSFVGPVQPGIVTSDHEAKEGIVRTDGRGLLDKIAKLDISSWSYKHGRGDGKTHTGPMAQDVQDKLGDTAAPGGKKIDLITLNGMNMSAIAELKKQQDAIKANKDNTTGMPGIINAITTNTDRVLDKLEALLSITTVATQINKKITLSFKSLLSRIPKFKFKKGDTTDDTESDTNTEEPGNNNKSFKDHLRDFAKQDHRSIGGQLGGLAASASVLLMDAIGKTKDGLIGAKNKINDKVIQPGKGKLWEIYDKQKQPTIDLAKKLYADGTELVGKVYRYSSEKVSNFFKNILPSGIDTVKNLLGKAKNGLYDLLDQPVDVYTTDGTSPILRAVIMGAGGYFDQITKKTIRRPGDIKGPVVDHEGNVVVTVEDIEKGLVDKDGNKIKPVLHKLAGVIASAAITGFNFIKDKAQKLLNSAKGGGAGILDTFKNMFKGLGNGNSNTNRLLTEIRDMLNDRLAGEKIDFGKADKITEHAAIYPNAITGNAKALYKSGKNVIDKAKNVYKRVTTPLTPAEKEAAKVAKDEAKLKRDAKISDIKNKLGQAKDKVMESNYGIKATAAVNKVRNAKPATAIGNRYNKIKNSRVGQHVRNTGGKIRSIGSGIFNSAKSLASTVFGDDEGTSDPNTVDHGEQMSFNFGAGPDTSDADALQSKIDHDKNSGGSTDDPAFNDKDGDGRRDGNWQDQLLKKEEQRLAEKRKDKAQADLNVRYKGERNVLDQIAEKAKKAFGLVTDALGGLTDMVSSYLGIKAATGVAEVALGTGGVVAAGEAAAAGTAAATAGKSGMLMRGGKALWGAARLAIPMATTIATVGIETTVAVASGLLSLISLPVLLGVAALAVTGYVIYRGVKFIRRNNASELELIRMAQYGIHASNKDVFHLVYALEDKLGTDCVGYSNGRAYLMDKKIDIKGLYDDFGISLDNSTQVANFDKWFINRFRPVFLTHLTALYGIDNKRKLSEVNDLDVAKKLKYVLAAAFEEGPYDDPTSPFKEINNLMAGTGGYIQKLVNTLADKLKKEKSKDDKSAADKIGTMADVSETADKFGFGTPEYIAAKKRQMDKAKADKTASDIKEAAEDKAGTPTGWNRFKSLFKANKTDDNNKGTHVEGNNVATGKVTASGKSMPVALPKAFNAAKKAEDKYGIPAEVTLAQFTLESANGTRMPAGSNNPFGIKARKGEPYVESMTTEHENGVDVKKPQRFAAFSSLDDAFDSHGELLANRSPYKKARQFLDDPVKFAHALTGVYATDPNYGSKLESIMNRQAPLIAKINLGDSSKTIDESDSLFKGDNKASPKNDKPVSTVITTKDTKAPVDMGGVQPTGNYTSKTVTTPTVTANIPATTPTTKPPVDSIEATKPTYKPVMTPPPALVGTYIPSHTRAVKDVHAENTSNSLISVTNILDKSLDVQTQMLGVLEKILSSVSPAAAKEMAKAIKDAISNASATKTTTTTTQSSSRPAVELPVNLSRSTT